jgi:hypothetical protein
MRPAAKTPRVRRRLLGGAVALLLALLLLDARLPSAEAGGAASPADPARARDALRVFQRASKAKLPGERIEALRALADVVHETVAKRLLAFTRSEKDPEVLTVAMEALARQTPSAPKILPKLSAMLSGEVDAQARRLAKGDAGMRIDPRSGNADTTSPEGRSRLRATRLRAGMLLALLSTLDALGWEPGPRPPDLTPLLQDPSDALVIAVLDWMGRHKVSSALPAVLDLLRMYPTEASWETGAVIDLGGTNASAKATWMVRFGHPDKQRARPEVYQSLQAMLSAVLGQTFETPEALAEHLARPESKRRPGKRHTH